MASFSAAASALSSSAAELDAGSSSSVTSEPWEATLASLEEESRLLSQSSFPRPSAPKSAARSEAEEGAAAVERAVSCCSPCGCCIEKSEPDDDEASTCVGCCGKKKKRRRGVGVTEVRESDKERRRKERKRSSERATRAVEGRHGHSNESDRAGTLSSSSAAPSRLLGSERRSKEGPQAHESGS